MKRGKSDEKAASMHTAHKRKARLKVYIHILHREMSNRSFTYKNYYRVFSENLCHYFLCWDIRIGNV